MLTFEVNNCPVEIRRNVIMDFIEENSAVHVGPANTSKIQDMAKEIMAMGAKYKDACHVASAILAQCDYFISTDKRLLKYRTDKIKLVNPVEFVSEMEDGKNE